MHGAPDQTDPAIRHLSRLDHRMHPRHVRGKAGHRHLTLEPLDQLGHGHADLGLRPGMAIDKDVGAVADHGQNALVSERGQGLNVGAFA